MFDNEFLKQLKEKQEKDGQGAIALALEGVYKEQCRTNHFLERMVDVFEDKAHEFDNAQIENLQSQIDALSAFLMEGGSVEIDPQYSPEKPLLKNSDKGGNSLSVANLDAALEALKTWPSPLSGGVLAQTHADNEFAKDLDPRVEETRKSDDVPATDAVVTPVGGGSIDAIANHERDHGITPTSAPLGLSEVPKGELNNQSMIAPMKHDKPKKKATEEGTE